ncbi:transposase [Streptomyces sp. NPDC127033]|uniref:transposase n=1 Tax=Streptomyces sp. NPDC127033 TaxID=3347110 RepID=UPI00365C2F18
MPGDTSGRVSGRLDGWDREAFVEEMGLLWEAAGSGRMDGRILGYLLITDIPYVSSGKLAEALKVSAGSVSLATRRLVEAGFLKRHAVPGERSRYFRVDDDVWGSFLAGERRYLDRQHQLAEQALELLGPEEEAPRRRLRNMRDYMRWVRGGHQDLLARWREYQRRPGTDEAGADEAGADEAGTAPAEGWPEEAPEQRRPSTRLSPVLARQLVPDALWAYAEPLLTAPGGMPSTAERDERTVLTAVVYVLTSGCGWQQLPAQFGTSSATAHRRFTAWSEADLWRRWLTAVTGAPAGALDASAAAWCAEIVRAAGGRRQTKRVSP